MQMIGGYPIRSSHNSKSQSKSELRVKITLKNQIEKLALISWNWNRYASAEKVAPMNGPIQ
jgi:hypothetical protein